mmetsp:Transcript_4288/g.6907  ORF Transcript_4288/g.6907 Transcript_4288/m.6907 type:complete len:106 (+) Transcript_4288:13-330(+)
MFQVLRVFAGARSFQELSCHSQHLDDAHIDVSMNSWRVCEQGRDREGVRASTCTHLCTFAQPLLIATNMYKTCIAPVVYIKRGADPSRACFIYFFLPNLKRNVPT